MKGFILIVFGGLIATGSTVPVDNGGCEILPFEAKIFNESLLLGNKFMCRTNKDRIPASDFCEHLYKCPLDFSERQRQCAAVCRVDGTWDYTYPSCEDMVPLADAILHAIEGRNSGKKGDEIVLFSTGNNQGRIKRFVNLVSPPKASTTSPPQTKTTEKTETPAPEPTLPKSVHLKKLEALCVGHMCPFLKGGKTCRAIEDMNTNDAQLQTRICHICVKLFCRASINLFGSGAK